MFLASQDLLDKYQAAKERESGKTKDAPVPVPLISTGRQEDFQLLVKEATNIGLVRQISLIHEVLGGFDLHKGPIKEYEEILNTILINNNFEALLLTIPREKRVAAANMLGEFLVASLGEEEVERLFDGVSTLPYDVKLQTEKMLDFLKSDAFKLDVPNTVGAATLLPLVQIEPRKNQNKITSGKNSRLQLRP